MVIRSLAAFPGIDFSAFVLYEASRANGDDFHLFVYLVVRSCFDFCELFANFIK